MNDFLKVLRLIKTTEKRYGNAADGIFSQKQKPHRGWFEEQLKRQSDAFLEICDGLIALRNQSLRILISVNLFCSTSGRIKRY